MTYSDPKHHISSNIRQDHGTEFLSELLPLYSLLLEPISDPLLLESLLVCLDLAGFYQLINQLRVTGQLWLAQRRKYYDLEGLVEGRVQVLLEVLKLLVVREVIVDELVQISRHPGSNSTVFLLLFNSIINTA